MTDPTTSLEYRPGKAMAFEPINVAISEVVGTLRLNEPIVVMLEPGDATRYVLLLVPMRKGDSVSPHLGFIGISPGDDYLFVSYLSSRECPGTFVPFGPDESADTYDVDELTKNEWSRIFLSWWLTNLCEATY